MLRLPNNALQKALIKLLSEKLDKNTVAVYDFVPYEAMPPYITLGAIVVNDMGTKTEDCCKVNLQINIWSEYEGRYEINRIAENIISILCSQDGYMDLTADGFVMESAKIDQYEAYPEDGNGYNGVIAYEVQLRNLLASAKDI